MKSAAAAPAMVLGEPLVLTVFVIGGLLIAALVAAFVAYIVIVNVRFNRRNPHAYAAAKLRKRVVSASSHEDAMSTYRELRDLVSTNVNEPDLNRYLMEAAEPLARTAGDKRDVATAEELYQDAQGVTDASAMPVLRELMRSFLPQDRGKALVCVELLGRLAEKHPKHKSLYWAAQHRFSGRP